MLANTTTLCIASIVLLFIANRVHFGYNRGLHTLADRLFDALGIISSISFCLLQVYENQNLYVIPQIMFFISACMLVRHKTKQKFCLPFWRTVRVAILALIIFGGAGYAIELFSMTSKEMMLNHMGIVVICSAIIMIALMIATTNCVFNHILNRRRVSSYYY